MCVDELYTVIDSKGNKHKIEPIENTIISYCKSTPTSLNSTSCCKLSKLKSSEVPKFDLVSAAIKLYWSLVARKVNVKDTEEINRKSLADYIAVAKVSM